MTRFVLDASTVLSWCFPDEEAQKAQEISELIAGGDTVIVPAFWRHEILSALLVGERRNRLTPELIQTFVSDLNQLPVGIDEQATAEIVFNTTQALCRKHGLTAYDAAYLEIAMRDRYPLATVDCPRAHASAASMRLAIGGCEWKITSTSRDGRRSARFWSASLFMPEMNGAIDGIAV